MRLGSQGLPFLCALLSGRKLVRAATRHKGLWNFKDADERDRVCTSHPIIDEQSGIVAVLSDMDAEIAAPETEFAKTRAVKQGMMQVLLTGEVRLA